MLDIASMDITESMVPVLTVSPVYLEEAASCGLCQVSRTMNGSLRVYAKTVPSAVITASLALLETERESRGILSASAAVARIDITIPAEGWTKTADDEKSVGAVCIDIADEAIEPELVPLLTVVPEHLGTAADCDLSTYARTLRGALRVYAAQPPSSEIHASLALLGVVQNIDDKLPTEGGGAYVLPTASETRLGVMKVGDGLHVAKDGTVSVIKATDEDIERVLGEVYSPDQN